MKAAVTEDKQKPEDKKLKIAKLRELHQPTFERLSIPEAVFIPKMAYRPKGKDELYISYFPSEMQRGQDLYTEFTSKDYTSEDPLRTLWKWRYNPHWATEYDQTEPGSTNVSRYLVPVSELIRIDEKTDSSQTLEVKLEDIMNPDEDAPVDQLTIRDIAAILMQKPVSKKQWLNKIITTK